MTQLTTSPAVARFGPYEVNTQSGEMRKYGIRIKLGEQPLRILMLLIERQGELVTREELRSKLWADNTFVGFDHSLNSAVQRLRESLSDTAEKARWIETVPRRGYRFVAAVEWVKTNGNRTNGSENLEAQVKEAQTVPRPEVPSNPQPLPPIPVSHKDRGTRRWVWISVAMGAALIAAGLFVWMVRRNSKSEFAAIRSLAVLPLQNLSGDPSQEYFVDGMTDELITALAQSRSLRVTSRTSAMQFKNVQRPVKEIAKTLGVDAILEGSVMRSGDRVHMTVQLIRASDDTHIWAESYDRDLNEAFAIASDFSQTIAKEVRVAISSGQPPRYVDPQAHDAYLRGRFYWFSEKDEGARGYFEQAIRLKPDYAAAWSGLADYYAASAVSGEVPPNEFRTAWEADARKAIELDDSSSDAHNTLSAWYLFGAWDWKKAEPESERSIELNPNNAEPYHLHSYVLTVAGRMAEALEEQKRGMEHDPFARPWALGYAYYRMRQFDAAIAELRLRSQANPKDSGLHFMLSGASHFAGLEREALDEMAQGYTINGRADAVQAIRKAFAHGGYKAAALWRLQDTRAHKHGYQSPYWMAMMSGLAEQKEETLSLLEAAYEERSPRLVFLQHEPEFDFIHSEPRYQEIVKKLGLPTGQ